MDPILVQYPMLPDHLSEIQLAKLNAKQHKSETNHTIKEIYTGEPIKRTYYCTDCPWEGKEH